MPRPDTSRTVSEFVHPPPVSAGDRAVILPTSRAVTRSVLERGAERLRERFDLRVTLHPLCERPDEYLDANPAAVAGAFADCFADETVGAVVAACGGDRQVRLHRHLDAARLRENPTRFFGISDNTNLHCALSAAGVVSYYGGQVLPGIALDERLHPYTEEHLRRALFEERIGEIAPAEEYTDGYYDFETGEPREWKPTPGWTWERFDGSVAGRLWGGCLEVLLWVLASDRHVPDPATVDGGVLAVETSEELPTAADVRRALTCLGERDLLGRFDAVVVGRPKARHEDPRSDDERRRYRGAQRDAVRGALDRYNPDAGVVFDVDFGHTDPHVPVPVGGEVALSPGDETIRFR